MFSSTSVTTAAISLISAGPMPRVVTAGVPNRRPLVYQGPLGSNGIGLRLSVIPHLRMASSACRPVMPEGRGDVDEHQVVVGPARDHLQARLHECLGEGPGVLDDLLRVGGELGPEGLGEGDRLGRHHVGQGAAQHQRAAAVDVLLELLGAEHQPAARAAQGLVGRRRDDVGVGERVLLALQHLAGDEAREVGHVDHQDRADACRRSRASGGN